MREFNEDFMQMHQGWKSYQIGELVDLKQGLAINKQTKHLVVDKPGLPLLKIRNLIDGETEDYIDSQLVSKQCIAQSEDIIYTRTGQVGLVFTGRKGVIHNNCFKVIPLEKIDRNYLFQFLKNPSIRKYVNDIAGGSVQRDLNHNLFKSIPINLPPLPIQRRIASILGALDEKIELNLEMNKTLEEMAMALYRHWFVDFGPFQDGNFVESELGMIPEEWEVKSVGDIAKILDNKRVPLSTKERSTRKGSFPYYGASGIIDYIDDFIFNGEFVIISEDGENLRSRKTPIAFCAFGKFWVNNHAHIVQGKGIGINELLIQHFAQLDLNPYITGAVQPKLSKQNLLLVKIPIPVDLSVVNMALANFHSLSRLIISNIEENQALVQIRDTLLPKLISGEIEVKAAEEEVSKAV